MPATRSSARIASQTSSNPSSEQTKAASKSTGSKRKSEPGSSPAPKREKQGVEKEQKTIEETLPATEGANGTTAAPEVKKFEHAVTSQAENVSDPKIVDSANATAAESNAQPHEADSETREEEPSKAAGVVHQTGQDEQGEDVGVPQTNGSGETNGTSTEKAVDTEMEMEPKVTENGLKMAQDNVNLIEGESKQQAKPSEPGTAVQPEAREEDTPASILEKGIIYFFFRGRVGIDEPQEVGDIARSYMVMRPLPHGAKLGEGTVGDEGTCRMLALPKKVLPLSGKDRFLAFVEKANTTFKDLKDNVLSSSDYMTKTVGARHSPATTPIAEGVYAITTTGRESHLAYILTIPSELGEVQKDVGLRERGSFVTSAKNPQYSSPANAGLPKGADYPKEILDEFRSLRWMPLQPKLLDYENTQFLLIGQSKGIESAMEQQKEDERDKKETPMQEMEKLEGEDEIRVKHLKGNDAVFADLGLSSQEYPNVPSTW